MSILRAPKLTTEFTGDLELDLHNLRIEYLQKQAKMMNEFSIAFMVVSVLGAVGLVIALCLR